MNFKDRFLRLLEADAPVAPVNPAPTAAVDPKTVDPVLSANPEDEKAAFSAALDKGTSPSDYNVPHPASKSDEQKQQQIEELKQWIATIDDFIEFLNAPKDTSIQVRLHTAGCDTMFDDIARSEKKKISRLAADLSSLSESFKGYLISANA